MSIGIISICFELVDLDDRHKSFLIIRLSCAVGSHNNVWRQEREGPGRGWAGSRKEAALVIPQGSSCDTARQLL